MTNSPLDIELLRQRDPAMTERVMAAVRYFARRYLRTPSDIENVVQDAIAELFDKLARGDQPSSVTQWVMTAASNATKRRLTQQRRVHVPFLSTMHTPEQPTASETLRAREQLHRVDRTLAQMPETTAEAVIATQIEGRRTGSVADELGVAPGTLRKNLTRARLQLRHELSAEEKLERLREIARERRRQLEIQQSHAPAPGFVRPRERSDSSVAKR
ncbi:MAG: sigma-70 family RNA polymerase sigma factor [Enhygromyxa sp.]